MSVSACRTDDCRPSVSPQLLTDLAVDLRQRQAESERRALECEIYGVPLSAHDEPLAAPPLRSRTVAVQGVKYFSFRSFYTPCCRRCCTAHLTRRVVGIIRYNRKLLLALHEMWFSLYLFELHPHR